MGRAKFLKNWREFLEGGNDNRFFLKKGNHPPPSSRADGPPGRRASGQTGLRADGRRTSGRKHMKKLQSSSGQAAGQGSRAAGGRAEAGSAASLHLFSIGNYFCRTIPSESNISPKIII